MRFKIDENLPKALEILFAESGHDAISVEDQGLAGQPDGRIADVSHSEGRALVTLDTDFTDIRAFPPSLYSGIVVFRLRSQGLRSVLSFGRRFLDRLENESLVEQLWIVEDGRIRIRN